jgi:hypothetical protein
LVGFCFPGSKKEKIRIFLVKTLQNISKSENLSLVKAKKVLRLAQVREAKAKNEFADYEQVSDA